MDSNLNQMEEWIRQALARIQPDERYWVGLLSEVLYETAGGLMLSELLLSQLPPNQDLEAFKGACERLLKWVKFTYCLEWELKVGGELIARFATFFEAFRRQRALELEGVAADFSISRVERNYRRRLNGETGHCE